MGNHNIGRAFAGAAEVFWIMVPEGETPTKELTLRALEAVGEYYRRADAEFDDELIDWTTPLGRMVAIAFDATTDEMQEETDDASPWRDGPERRFRKHFDFC